MSDPRLGAVFWTQCTDWDTLSRRAQHADKLGYDSLWVWDHLFSIDGSPDRPIFEPWTILSGLAAKTDRIRLGTLCTSVPFRNPGLVAKQSVTLDHISGGRAILGLGAGWLDEEFAAHGISFDSDPLARGDRLLEAAHIIRRLLDGQEVTSHGRFYDFEAARHYPMPEQEHLPILIGGSGKKTALPAVARHADMWNPEGSVEHLRQKDEVLRRFCDEVARDHAEIERLYGYRVILRDDPAEAERVYIERCKANGMDEEYMWTNLPPTWVGTPTQIAERMKAYQAIGFSYLLVEFIPPYDEETMERLTKEVLPMVAASGD